MLRMHFSDPCALNARSRTPRFHGEIAQQSQPHSARRYGTRKRMMARKADHNLNRVVQYVVNTGGLMCPVFVGGMSETTSLSAINLFGRSLPLVSLEISPLHLCLIRRRSFALTEKANGVGKQIYLYF